MLPEPRRLSLKATEILERIAQGQDYGQILAAHPLFTYIDICSAAQEALNLSRRPRPPRSPRQDRHTRAQERWTPEEEAQLRALVQSGETVARISGHLQRKRGAIRARILKLGLVDQLLPAERERFEKNIHSDRTHPESRKSGNHGP
jgi:hypothetical protein